MIQHWRRGRAARRVRLSDTAWQRTTAELSLLRHLDPPALARLRELVQLFLDQKDFIAKGELGAEFDLARRLPIAVQACLPILNLGLNYYRDWRTIIVYPAEFIAEHEYRDEAGVVHRSGAPLAGEAWERGPLVLSWQDVLCRGDGFNVVIHECAHKLDMLNGAMNGFPPLHADMDAAWWSRAFGAVYEQFCRQVESGIDTVLDPYGAENPGEFFAVVSETFFELPALLRAEYPAVYRQLSAFYRQDPAAGLALTG